MEFHGMNSLDGCSHAIFHDTVNDMIGQKRHVC